MVDLGSGLASLRQIAALPRWPAGVSAARRAELVAEEAAVRDRFDAYCFDFDSQDLDAVMAYFTDDCVITNPRGKVSGAAEIRANYQVLFGYWNLTRHIWTNVVIRFPGSVDEAYLGALHYGVLVADDRTLAGIGTDVRRLRKVDGQWNIAERWIADDVDYAVTLHAGEVEDPDKVRRLHDAATSS